MIVNYFVIIHLFNNIDWRSKIYMLTKTYLLIFILFTFWHQFYKLNLMTIKILTGYGSII